MHHLYFVFLISQPAVEEEGASQKHDSSQLIVSIHVFRLPLPPTYVFEVVDDHSQRCNERSGVVVPRVLPLPSYKAEQRHYSSTHQYTWQDFQRFGEDLGGDAYVPEGRGGAPGGQSIQHS